MRRQFFAASLTLIFFVSLFALTAHAAVVGRFTLVIGQVDLLKQGKLPAIPVKVQDGVEPGDVIRTKTKAKAQLTMVDDSIITLAPESRLAIADYQYNPARGERRAVVRLFRGLVHTVVNRIIKTEEPDFIMETHTATIGVRGTNWYTLLGPNSTLAALSYGACVRKAHCLRRPGYTFAFQAIYPGTQTLPAPGSDSGDPQNAGENDGHGADRRRVWIWPAYPRRAAQFQTPLTLPVSPDQKLYDSKRFPRCSGHSSSISLRLRSIRRSHSGSPLNALRPQAVGIND